MPTTIGPFELVAVKLDGHFGRSVRVCVSGFWLSRMQKFWRGMGRWRGAEHSESVEFWCSYPEIGGAVMRAAGMIDRGSFGTGNPQE